MLKWGEEKKKNRFFPHMGKKRFFFFSSPPWGFLTLRKKSNLRISYSGQPYFLLSPRCNGEGASAKLFEEAMPRFLPRNRPVRFDPRSPRQSLAVHARRKLTREGYFKSIKGVGPSGKRDTLFSHLTLTGLKCRLLINSWLICIINECCKSRGHFLC